MKEFEKYKYLWIWILVIVFTGISAGSGLAQEEKTTQTQTDELKTVYDYDVVTIRGDTISLSKYEGKKMMIVNTASKCEFTYQYEQLEALYQKYKDMGFVILGFPSNNFFAQEPGSNSDIALFCEKNYGVTFPMMAKIDVKGKKQEPLYKYLTTISLNGVTDERVKWNFQKYLIGVDGKIEKVIYSRTEPFDKEIVSWIEGE